MAVAPEFVNRFNGLGVELIERGGNRYKTVPRVGRSPDTGLKPGVNEMILETFWEKPWGTAPHD